MPRLKGTPKTGGRRKGTRNLVPDDIKHIAKLYTERAMRRLWEIADNPKHPLQLSALNSIFDRGWGKPAQALDVGDGSPVLHMVTWLEHGHGEPAPPKLIDGTTWRE